MKQTLTHSRGKSFKQCRKRHWWEYEIGYRRPVDAKALRMGSALHMALDAIKRGTPQAEGVSIIESEYNHCPGDYEPDEWVMERETVVSMLLGYLWRWGEARLQIIASEMSFRIPLVNPDTGKSSRVWELAGVIDGIARVEDGRVVVLEHKTASESLEPDSDYWRRLQIDAQISIYVIAARKLGFDVESVLYDVIRKPEIRPNDVALLDENGNKIVLDEHGDRVLTQQGKPRQTGDKAKGYVLQTRPMTPEEWSERLLGDIGERPDFYFARHEIARLDSDLEETKAELWDLQKTIRIAEREGRWYKTVDRNTCPFCPYFGLCTSRFEPLDGEVPEGFVKVDDVHPELGE